jgi:hypothetical protein
MLDQEADLEREPSKKELTGRIYLYPHAFNYVYSLAKPPTCLCPISNCSI